MSAKMWVIAHRGGGGTWPENTLLAIGRAIDCGVDWVEIDIRIADGAIIVLHDDTLDRTTNGHGSVYEYPLTTLRELDAGKGEKIPLLEEVMDLVNARVGLNIEIKQPDTAQQLVEFTTAYLRRQPNWRNRLMFSSFLPEIMAELATSAPAGCLLGALSEETTPESARRGAAIDAFSLNISLRQLSISLVQEAHGQGLKVLVYTVNEIEDIRRCVESSVDGVFTDFPERVIAFLDNSLMIPGNE
jgi:glycerophosphoryl diester phosphodiesterase